MTGESFFGGVKIYRDTGAKYFGIDEKNIRRWKPQSDPLHKVVKDGFSKAKHLPGSGRRPLSEDLEELVYQWVITKRLQKQRVTRKGIQQKAIELYESTIKGEQEFHVSKGLLEKFMTRYSLSLRRKTTQSQRLTVDFIPKIHKFILYFRKLMSEKEYSEENIWAFDETAVWFDSVGNSTIEKIGAEEVEMFTTGHDKQNITVGRRASSAGKKKVPYIIFRGKDNTTEDKKKVAYIIFRGKDNTTEDKKKVPYIIFRGKDNTTKDKKKVPYIIFRGKDNTKEDKKKVPYIIFRGKDNTTEDKKKVPYIIFRGKDNTTEDKKKVPYIIFRGKDNTTEDKIKVLQRKR